MDFTNELQALGTEILALARSGLDMATEAAPMVAREALAYWTAMVWVGAGVMLALIAGLVVLGKFLIKRSQKHVPDGYMDETKEVLCTLGIASIVIAIILFGMFLLMGLPEVVKSVAAPSLFFIENASELFK